MYFLCRKQPFRINRYTHNSSNHSLHFLLISKPELSWAMLCYIAKICRIKRDNSNSLMNGGYQILSSDISSIICHCSQDFPLFWKYLYFSSNHLFLFKLQIIFKQDVISLFYLLFVVVATAIVSYEVELKFKISDSR